ncbi:SbcC/MukB-like Walker B domain-containing protein [Neoroseomonas soli]|uniref:Tyr recombinase domain-containing protein n=1 Tax=Neoroseomonas soli TaxID=1081025 RepID=A0A9X9WVD0_9PROT|nr:SbcC/MukB-like Walker B domain-containing protein [Neoroseomonas soli]MBR0671109.1 hypothetical protein [Neoroseomonas soli]
MRRWPPPTTTWSACSAGATGFRRREEPLWANGAAGLGIEVLDEWTGQDRPAATLSGGEGFCVALALARGLADTVQAHAGARPVDALLVDEEFGSLDEEALDKAMEVLAGPQGNNRVVGIISHVGELKPRIPARLVLHPDNMKAGNSIDWPVPARSAALIDEYVRRFRSAIADATNPFLLPGEGGTGCRSHNGLSAALVKTIAEYCGVRTNLHLLRRLAAWMYLKVHPGHYEDVRRLLGHRDVRTTMAFYVEFETAAVATRFDGTILKEKSATRTIAATAWGKLPKRRSRKAREVAP